MGLVRCPLFQTRTKARGFADRADHTRRRVLARAMAFCRVPQATHQDSACSGMSGRCAAPVSVVGQLPYFAGRPDYLVVRLSTVSCGGCVQIDVWDV